uniref:Uncharacterized protein n=1 Tax=Anguilla anguilla TaxID=7936 RepID=A0A0E9S7N3_ANGAN
MFRHASSSFCFTLWLSSSS